MADAALFMGWNEPKVGREAHAMELWASTMTFWTRQLEAGNVESFEPVILARHGGTLNGFILIRGTTENLDRIRRSDEYNDLIMQVTYCLEGFGTVDAYIGDQLKDRMSRYSKLAGKG